MYLLHLEDAIQKRLHKKPSVQFKLVLVIHIKLTMCSISSNEYIKSSVKGIKCGPSLTTQKDNRWYVSPPTWHRMAYDQLVIKLERKHEAQVG